MAAAQSTCTPSHLPFSRVPQAMDPRCRVAIVLGRTASIDDKTVPRHKQHSMIIVPMDTPGLKVVRPLTVFGTYTITYLVMY